MYVSCMLFERFFMSELCVAIDICFDVLVAVAFTPIALYKWFSIFRPE